MAVNWYPGHMNKARNEMKKAMPNVDLVIEVMDARIPYSSENPTVSELRGERPCIKILNKNDLADPAVTKQWQDYYEQEKGVKAIAMSCDQPAQARKILDLARKLLPHRNDEFLKPIRVMIMGIPNVGKSTLINALSGKNIAKVGDEPAVTKGQQKIRLDKGVFLSDTPGILWPRMGSADFGYRLAVSGAIKNTAIEFEDVALYAANYLLQAYPDEVMVRYKLKQLPECDTALLDAIGRKRGGLRPGGVVDLHKASEVLLHDYRSGAIGRISLETPLMIEKSEQVDG